MVLLKFQQAFAEDEDTDNVEQLIDNKINEAGLNFGIGICILHILALIYGLTVSMICVNCVHCRWALQWNKVSTIFRLFFRPTCTNIRGLAYIVFKALKAGVQVGDRVLQQLLVAPPPSKGPAPARPQANIMGVQISPFPPLLPSQKSRKFLLWPLFECCPASILPGEINL